MIRLVPLCLCFILSALAQDSLITGHITDANRDAVATAVVTVTKLNSGSRRQVLSNARGFFQLAPLAPGTYRIDVVKPGFKPLLRSGVELGKSLAANVDLQMEHAEASAGSLLAYMCGLSLGSCEMIEPPAVSVSVSFQTDSPLFP
jgi:hypothetical protein